MERPVCQLILASSARAFRESSVGAVVTVFTSYCCVWVVLLELNELLIRLATMAIAEAPGSSSPSTELVGGAIASIAKATSPITKSRGDHVTRFRRCARVRLLRCRVREKTSQPTDLGPLDYS